MNDPKDETGAARILVVDDEESVRYVLTTYLTRLGHDVRSAESAEAALAILAEAPQPDVALVDIVMPDKDGLDLMSEIHQRCPETQIVLITGHASVDTAIRAIRGGAYDYLQKPFQSLEHVASTVQRAIEKKRLSMQVHGLISQQAVLNREMAEVAGRLARSADRGRDADDDVHVATDSRRRPAVAA